MTVRYIPITEVELSDPTGINFARNAGIDIRFKDPSDPRTIILSTLDWLCGSNSWGVHNSMHFAQPTSKVQAGIRIMEAAEKARDEGRSHVPLAEGDYGFIKEALDTPLPHPGIMPMSPPVVRAILPIYEAIESATTDVPEGWAKAEKKKDDGAEKAKTAVEKP